MVIAPLSLLLRNIVGPYRKSTRALKLPEGPIEVYHLFYIDDPKSKSLYKYALLNVDQLWSRTRESYGCKQRIVLNQHAVRQKVNGYNQAVILKPKYATSCHYLRNDTFCTSRKQARAFDESVRKLLAESHLPLEQHSVRSTSEVAVEEGHLSPSLRGEDSGASESLEVLQDDRVQEEEIQGWCRM
ncbi:hypothetical protein COOONC_08228 [Cooperia oncophora]